MPVLLTRETHWVCPNCPAEDRTYEARPHSRFHTCPGLRGLTAPMVEAGVRCEVRAVDREDYIGTEQAGRTMAVVTERNDGQDTAVFAPLAVGSVR